MTKVDLLEEKLHWKSFKMIMESQLHLKNKVYCF